MEKIIFWFECLRAYALPMSIMAWVIPFVFGYTNNGNVFYGLLALVGIVCIHLATNLFDDIIDYKKFLRDKEKNNLINLKRGNANIFSMVN